MNYYKTEENIIKQKKIINIIENNVRKYYPFNDIHIMIKLISNDIDIYKSLKEIIEYNETEKDLTCSIFLPKYKNFIKSNNQTNYFIIFDFDGDINFFSYEEFINIFDNWIIEIKENWINKVYEKFIKEIDDLYEFKK